MRIITAGSTDVPLARLASRSYYPALLKAGIRLFEWDERVLHAKTAVVDDTWATVGSSNLDYFSSFGLGLHLPGEQGLRGRQAQRRPRPDPPLLPAPGLSLRDPHREHPTLVGIEELGASGPLRGRVLDQDPRRGEQQEDSRSMLDSHRRTPSFLRGPFPSSWSQRRGPSR